MTRHLLLALGLALVAAATSLLLGDVGLFDGPAHWLFDRYRGESLWKGEPAAPWPVGAAGTGWSLQRRLGNSFADDPAHWEAAPPTPAALNYSAATTDADEDGLPDVWEIEHGLNPTIGTGIHGADGDFDGDGRTNREEYLAGTNPADRNSVLRLVIDSVTNEDVSLSFQAMAARSYTVQGTHNLAAGWGRLTDVAPGNEARRVSVVDETGGQAHRFYRVVTPAQP